MATHNRGHFKKGHDARRGRGGNQKGRSGRLPDAWKRVMRRCVNRPQVLKALKYILARPNHPAFIGALKFAAEQGYGKPNQELQVTARLTLEHLLAESRRDDLDQLDAPGDDAVPESRRLTTGAARVLDSDVPAAQDADYAVVEDEPPTKAKRRRTRRTQEE